MDFEETDEAEVVRVDLRGSSSSPEPSVRLFKSHSPAVGRIPSTDEITGEMDIEISEDADDEDDHESVTWYFSVSIWRARNLHGNNNGGRSSDPYVLVKYGEQELKTRVIETNLDPVWKSHVMFAHDGTRKLDLYVFDYEDFMSDDLLGKITLQLPEPMPEEPVVTVLDHEWIEVQPCYTQEQDSLVSFRNNLSRRVTKAMRVFHDDAHLFKYGTLGEVNVSVTAFRLEELPALVRDRETTIDRLKHKLNRQKRMSESTLADTTLRLQAELNAARRDALNSRNDTKRHIDNLMADHAARVDALKAQLKTVAEDRDELARAKTRLEDDSDGDRRLVDDLRNRIKTAEDRLARAENERDAARIANRKFQNQHQRDATSPRRAAQTLANVDDLSIRDLKERIQGLTLAYYWKLRQAPDNPMTNDIRRAINLNSLPSDPPLRLDDSRPNDDDDDDGDDLE
ncbi:hypothetical protein CTAYLR_002148 [Chrysophaeum taylorii]|uniref:C2 domain-containing protein n=1 Tax=Chrysophaeum taylorii TaxID=2483200 RepID=A0AAD7UNS5_9STRA|nr:hypothetical protein CTAYLR_002148 [Chrysophaeum taylorii]